METPMEGHFSGPSFWSCSAIPMYPKPPKFGFQSVSFHCKYIKYISFSFSISSISRFQYINYTMGVSMGVSINRGTTIYQGFSICPVPWMIYISHIHDVRPENSKKSWDRIPESGFQSRPLSVSNWWTYSKKIMLWYVYHTSTCTLFMYAYVFHIVYGSVSKPCTPSVHIKIAGIYGCSSP